ncbi:MAG: ectoine/hydroxyectoine ABC transporter ATP-binding protein EhuA [Thermomicrobiales bacterium]|nr:ectoine/hydroxyectoine ABC transporter ATP-binding protein EhuA [Thermomicrobiales bacterium]
MVSIRNLHKHYGELQVLKGVDLDIAPGEVVCVIGPSGSGKTTMLRCVNFLENYQDGRIYVDGQLVGYREQNGQLKPAPEKEVAKIRAETAMVFQQFNLFPHMTALRNVTFGPMKVRKVNKAEAEENARRLLARVGLADKADNYPSQLSGGQQQRVAIARALAMEPKVILFDEVTSALDPELVGEVLQVMTDLAQSHGVTMIVVTHEMGFARDVADRIVFMDGGVVVEQGPPSQVLEHPESERLQAFLRRLHS